MSDCCLMLSENEPGEDMYFRFYAGYYRDKHVNRVDIATDVWNPKRSSVQKNRPTRVIPLQSLPRLPPFEEARSQSRRADAPEEICATPCAKYRARCHAQRAHAAAPRGTRGPGIFPHDR